ncbi:MAG: redoxin domain-containing protein [Natronomonas sp.]
MTNRLDVGDRAPDFTLPCAGGSAYNDVSAFTLSESLRDGPVVLAFLPGAFTNTCTDQVCVFRDSYDAFERIDASVYGVTADMPFAQNVWIEQHDLPFSMLSDQGCVVTKDYGVFRDDMYDIVDSAHRSLFGIDSDGTVVYRWMTDGDPDFDALIDDVTAALAD